MTMWRRKKISNQDVGETMAAWNERNASIISNISLLIRSHCWHLRSWGSKIPSSSQEPRAICLEFNSDLQDKAIPEGVDG